MCRVAATVARDMAPKPRASMMVTTLSTARPVRIAAEKTEEPTMQHAMKHEKMAPKGTAWDSAAEPRAAMAARTAGGQTSTKVYMAPSKNAWMAPTSMILRSASMAAQARPTRPTRSGDRLASAPFLPLPSAGPAEPEFSPHVSAAASAPAARKAVESTKGAVGPPLAATPPASCPASMATTESPRNARPNVWESMEDDTEDFWPSAMSHASGAEKSSEVPTPPKKRPV
mmetsp:Transcript_19495/g.65447  ORF Transcript_19495/g.65447 Transcript_19495/m.65447 type:complete len:229 (+) Transcript_19495:277-963(+)